ncbi:hypothetical protein [Mycobacterium sp. 1274761.0]|uniref:hypothetical protein n=1 Tax=Mycobacterium sp. 1274761.0 TaxID=1834077 RepID=UPI0008006CFD|nr:hypothetical protein [Mycobacterium sp. 1274761.0]OBK71445.1 hypothetical protein A5651_18585 [Mycobacterium sp. 1274761.0]
MAGGAIVGALVAGLGAPVSVAAPATDNTTDTEAPAPKMTGDQALAIIQQDYDMGAGGGQLSNLVHEVLVLRNLGFKPSNANKTAIVEALDERPNQAPLVEALKATISYQRKIQAQAAAQQQQQGADQPGFAIGGAPAPFNQGGVIMGGPGGSSVAAPVG